MKTLQTYCPEVISFSKELFGSQSNEALQAASSSGHILSQETIMDNLLSIEDEGGLGVSEWEKECFG